MKAIITYVNGSMVENITMDDLLLAINDLQDYTENDKSNPYSISKIEIVPTWVLH